MSRTEVQKAVNGSTQPLTEEQVKKNQEKYGPNALAEGKKKTVPQIFLTVQRLPGNHPDHRCYCIRYPGRNRECYCYPDRYYH